MALFDWNQNGKKDIVDNYIEHQIYKNATENKETNNYSSQAERMACQHLQH